MAGEGLCALCQARASPDLCPHGREEEAGAPLLACRRVAGVGEGRGWAPGPGKQVQSSSQAPGPACLDSERNCQAPRGRAEPADRGQRVHGVCTLLGVHQAPSRQHARASQQPGHVPVPCPAGQVARKVERGRHPPSTQASGWREGQTVSTPGKSRACVPRWSQADIPPFAFSFKFAAQHGACVMSGASRSDSVAAEWVCSTAGDSIT